MKSNILLFIPRSVLLRMGKFQIKVEEKVETHCIFDICFKNRTVYEIMWKNIGEPGRTQKTIRRLRIACWMTKAIHTHTHTHTYTLNM